MTLSHTTPPAVLSGHPMTAPIGFGASGLGTLTWNIPDDVAQTILEDAWGAGFRYFDTSPLYGHGLSEHRLGRFLRGRPREDFLLSTKVGRYLVAPKKGEVVDTGQWVAPLPLKPVLDYSYDGTMRALEQSLNRLGVASIDIVYVHDLDRRNLGADFDRHWATALGGAFRALDELRRSGDIQAYGAGINESDVAADLVRATDLDILMLAGRYTLLEQGALADFLPLAEARGVDVVVAGVFNSGILVKPPTQGGNYDYGEAPPEIIERARRIAAVCAEFDVAMPAAAVQFPYGHPAVKTVVIGLSRPKYLRQNLDWFEADIPPALWARLKETGLLAADTPTP
ncbi:aldo/keto reductase [Siculibacillus lacustris]|uniref:Aldo/keto reductase n=1 Tax=Siculibacillus lacustris TaxID=1549641 RepID=A0A4Q9VXK2_9HYPH|nr:aldo/keto reductase [Siculibacillus lacustris]TBW40657.1 aldo/keto reductase [Siculibacillus lacustris]